MRSRHLYIFLTAAIICVNALALRQEMIQLHEKRTRMPPVFTGIRFAGLKDLLPAHVDRIGYYADKNLDDPQDALQFAQAQYTLAPLILDFNNTRHEYIVFDCSRPDIALEKIKEIRAVPLRQNQLGIILAQNPESKL